MLPQKNGKHHTQRILKHVEKISDCLDKFNFWGLHSARFSFSNHSGANLSCASCSKSHSAMSVDRLGALLVSF